MVKDKYLERIKAVKRISRIETGGPHGKAGIHAGKGEQRTRRMSTQDWLEEAEEDILIEKEIEMKVYESKLLKDEMEPETVTCCFCKRQTSVSTAHLHQDTWVGECCWDERLKTTE